MDLFKVFVLNELNKLLKVNNSQPGIINGMGCGVLGNHIVCTGNTAQTEASGRIEGTRTGKDSIKC